MQLQAFATLKMLSLKMWKFNTVSLYSSPYNHKYVARDMTHSSLQSPNEKMSNSPVTSIANLSLSNRQEIAIIHNLIVTDSACTSVYIALCITKTKRRWCN